MATQALASPINQLSRTGLTPTPAAAPRGPSQTLGETDFLTLLTTQLKNQDPLNPMDNTQSVAQLAQFSALQATNTLATKFTNFESNFAVSQASGLLGETVTVATADASGNSTTVSGTVKAIQVVNGSPQFTMVTPSGTTINGANGTPIQFNTSQIVGIAK